ncbi:hypothetical protein SAT01_07120 [Sinomonas atrocyanea]|nr:hypothetical protein SAT01_07120 [Sinomonas atrocyanea]GGG69573.1 hypothetical protein GCM10007172_22130 [Sinomonas atrocyanea]
MDAANSNDEGLQCEGIAMLSLMARAEAQGKEKQRIIGQSIHITNRTAAGAPIHHQMEQRVSRK